MAETPEVRPPEVRTPELELDEELEDALVPEVIAAESWAVEQRLTLLKPKLLPQVAQFLEDPEKGRTSLEKYAELVETLRKASIKLTYPSDWVINVVKNEDREIITGYLQDVGCERVAQVWGVSRVSGVTKRREGQEDEAQTYIVRCTADFLCERTGVYLNAVEGARWSGEGFFRKQAQRRGYLNPLHVEEAALRNLHGRAVRKLAGLSAVPLEELAACGLKTDKCTWIRWRGAKEEPEEPGEATRGRTARQELAELVRAAAKAAGKGVNVFLRELCKQQGIPEKDTVPELSDSQAADLLVVLRDQMKGGQR